MIGRRLPLVATAVVLSAVAVMVALGFWQLGRAEEKERLLARFEAAAGLPPVTLPASGSDRLLFRRSEADCRPTGPSRTLAGRNAEGKTGYIHRVDCGAFPADIGWSDRPQSVTWSGGTVEGMLAPDKTNGFRLIARRGLAGLQAMAAPNVADIPNNHRSYAFQWFAFAAAALIIYGLALRGRGKRSL